MLIVNLAGREAQPDVIALLVASQIHLAAEEAVASGNAIAYEYRSSYSLILRGLEQDGAILGLIGFETTGPGLGTIRDLAVAPEVQRQGIGRSLLSTLQDGSEYLVLEGFTLAVAAPFYRRCGFELRPEGAMPDGQTRLKFTWHRV